MQFTRDKILWISSREMTEFWIELLNGTFEAVLCSLSASGSVATSHPLLTKTEKTLSQWELYKMLRHHWEATWPQGSRYMLYSTPAGDFLATVSQLGPPSCLTDILHLLTGKSATINNPPLRFCLSPWAFFFRMLTFMSLLLPSTCRNAIWRQPLLHYLIKSKISGEIWNR